MACPACGAQGQPVHKWVRRCWRHPDFFQFGLAARIDPAGGLHGVRQNQPNAPFPARARQSTELKLAGLKLSRCICVMAQVQWIASQIHA